MKTFKEYIKFRSSFFEMARPAVSLDHEEMVEIKKIPIFYDEDDIRYLEQFQENGKYIERIWPNALRRRYMLLVKLHKAKLNGEDTRKLENVSMNFTDGQKKYSFKNIKTNLNKLYEKLSGDDDYKKYLGIPTDKIDIYYDKGREFVQNPNDERYYRVRRGLIKDKKINILKDILQKYINKNPIKGELLCRVKYNCKNLTNSQNLRLNNRKKDSEKEKDLSEKDLIKKDLNEKYEGFVSWVKDTANSSGKNKQLAKDFADKYFYKNNKEIKLNIIISTLTKLANKINQNINIKLNEKTKDLPKTQVRTTSQRGNVHGPYSYNFRNFRISSDNESLAHSDGFVVPDLRSIKRSINTWKIYSRLAGDSNAQYKSGLVPGKILYFEKDKEKQKDFNFRFKLVTNLRHFHSLSENKKKEIIEKAIKNIKYNSSDDIFEKIKEYEKKQGRSKKLIDDDENTQGQDSIIDKICDIIIKYFNRENMNVDNVYDFINNNENVLKNIVNNTQHISPHQWNSFHYRTGDPNIHSKTFAAGAIHPNKQQVEVNYAIIDIFDNSNLSLQKFWNFIKDNLFIGKNIIQIINEIQESILETLIIKEDTKELGNFLLKNLESISTQTLNQIKYKIGHKNVLPLARVFKNEILNNESNLEKIKKSKDYKAAQKAFLNFVSTESKNFVKQMTQLFSRLQNDKFNRKIRLENPYERKEVELDVVKLLKYFNSEEYSTSHSINSLKRLTKDQIENIEVEITEYLKNEEKEAEKKLNSSNKFVEGSKRFIKETIIDGFFNNAKEKTKKAFERILRSVSSGFTPKAPSTLPKSTPMPEKPAGVRSPEKSKSPKAFEKLLGLVRRKPTSSEPVDLPPEKPTSEPVKPFVPVGRSSEKPASEPVGRPSEKSTSTPTNKKADKPQMPQDVDDFEKHLDDLLS